MSEGQPVSHGQKPLGFAEREEVVSRQKQDEELRHCRETYGDEIGSIYYSLGVASNGNSELELELKRRMENVFFETIAIKLTMGLMDERVWALRALTDNAKRTLPHHHIEPRF